VQITDREKCKKKSKSRGSSEKNEYAGWRRTSKANWPRRDELAAQPRRQGQTRVRVASAAETPHQTGSSMPSGIC